jgi:hypothetical protein
LRCAIVLRYRCDVAMMWPSLAAGLLYHFVLHDKRTNNEKDL